MRRHLPVAVVATAAALSCVFPSAASASPAFSALTGANGAGTFNDRLDCGVENGAGDTWRYFWQDQEASDGSGVLDGRWNGDFEIHRGPAPGTAFLPNKDGRLAITVSSAGGRTGTAFFDTQGDGSCSNATLGLSQIEPNDPTAQEASGVVPVVATGGLGALRGLTGSGTASFTLQLTPGADNAAAVNLATDLDVLDPAVTVGSGFGRWDNLTAFLQRRLHVYVTLRNDAAAGDAFQTKVTGAYGGTGQFSGLPAGNNTIPHGGGTTIGFFMHNVNPNQLYTVGVNVALKDGLLVAQPPISGSFTFRAPLLP